MKHKIGCITIGQSPRIDVIPEIKTILGDNIEIEEGGALDGLTKEDIAKFAPKEGDYVLVSRLNDGTHVKIAKRYIIERLQKIVDRMSNLEYIIFICTGKFDHRFDSKAPIIFPSEVLENSVKPLINNRSIALITPDADQVEQVKEKWKNIAKNVYVEAANPYGDIKDIEKAAKNLQNKDIALTVLDCIGYNLEMKKIIMETTQKPAILPRTIVARLIKEIFSY